MSKNFLRLLATTFLLLMASELFAQEQIKIAILAYRPKPAIQAQWAPLANALNKAIPDYHFSIAAYDYVELQAVVASRQVDFVLTNPGSYLLLAHRSGLSAPLATLSNLEQGQAVNSFGGVIFTRADRPDIQTLRDIRGKTVAVPVTDSLGGYQMQAYELDLIGVHMPKDVQLKITGMPHDRVIDEVMSRRADVGFVRSGLIEEMASEGKLDVSQIRIINAQNLPEFPVQVSTRLYPEWPLSALPQTNKELKRKVASFLLTLCDNKPLARALQINGFDVPSDYSSVETVLRELRMPPFDVAPNFTNADVLQRYHWQLLAGLSSVALILLLGLRLWRANRNLKAEKNLVQMQSLQLRISELQLRTIIEAEPECVKLLARDGTVLQMNAAGLSMLEADTPEQIIGKKALAVVQPKFRRAFAKLVRDVFSGSTRNLEFAVQGLKGGQRWLDTHAVPMRDADGNITALLSVTRDITERRRAMEQLRSTAQELEFANAQIEEERSRLAERVLERTSQLVLASKAKDSFLATMSHEIRTPLGGLLGMMELLSLSPLNKEQTDMLHIAQNSGKSLLRIVDDILDWSKIEAGKLTLAPRPVSLFDLLQGVANTYAHVASAKGLILQPHIDDNLSAAYICDPLRLSQILNNFTSNAIKFTERGSIAIKVEHLASGKGKDTLRFSVQDSGVGIDAEQQSRLFQHYEQASSDTARMYGGTGLGLAICSRLAELMDSRIGLHSTPGLGSTFYLDITLPVASLSAQRELQHTQVNNHSPLTQNFNAYATDGKSYSVLVVDDHPVNRLLLKQQLEQLGLRVNIAEAGIVGLSLWWTESYDLIITDCHMPGMDGYELARSIREIEQHDQRVRVPIIAWTANVLAQEEGLCRSAGMDDLLTKPTELNDLRTMLNKWLTRTDAPPPAPTIATVHATPALAALDLNVLNQIAPGYALQVELLQEFSVHHRADMEDLRAALTTQDATAIKHAAHRAKGACRMVGALEMAELCAQIEQAARADNVHAAQSAANAALEHTLARLEDVIARLVTAQ